MNVKTYQTAVVVIPPESCWEQIQIIRRQHDRQVRRWMPHITLLYPFRPRDQFDAVARELRTACVVIEPFEARLTELQEFRHGQDAYTLWLAPEPREAFQMIEMAVTRELFAATLDRIQSGGVSPPRVQCGSHGNRMRGR
jgi:2'-5' RNA ligase